eukprot:gnl/MRDRNA2_/MRDRNA2_81366_c0_seq3.p1 gnl/MRDRNA2_/MRDRNA2_81366_c0~~gnl/MRDRNA2_/MRDRNA2_81366_c0_seq3.p1  ORF type:complete len:293 (+),score=79.14 gnl/MRDRNA2_/MRDRNA2_81366_c0_seq3:90-968(+)
MASFIESALLKMSSENSTPFEDRLNSLVKQLDSKAASTALDSTTTSVSPTPKTPADVASSLLELTEVASQLAHVEMMLAQVTENTPEEESAKRYHEISLQALECSKQMLKEKQAHCLQDLGAMIGSPIEATKDKATPTMEPDSTSATWNSWSKEEIDAVPEFVPESKVDAKLIGSGSLRQDLELLRQRRPECVLIVRKIKKLGFESPQILDNYFSQYGEVKELLVAHSHVKPTAKRPNGRVRPAALGFVVMATEEGAQNAFKAGTEQWLHGVNIELAPFESFDAHYAEEEDH